MATVEKMSIALTQDMAALVRQAVDSGEYVSSSEVIREALRAWKMKRTFQEQQREELRALLHEDINSGPGRFETIDALIEEAQQQLDHELQG